MDSRTLKMRSSHGAGEGEGEVQIQSGAGLRRRGGGVGVDRGWNFSGCAHWPLCSAPCVGMGTGVCHRNKAKPKVGRAQTRNARVS